MNEPGFSCFVIMPFNLKTDADGKALDFNAIYDDIIAPAITGEAMREAGGPKIECVRCDRIAEAGWVHRRMVEHGEDPRKSFTLDPVEAALLLVDAHSGAVPGVDVAEADVVGEDVVGGGQSDPRWHLAFLTCVGHVPSSVEHLDSW